MPCGDTGAVVEPTQDGDVGALVAPDDGGDVGVEGFAAGAVEQLVAEVEFGIST